MAEPLADRVPSLPHPRTSLVGRADEITHARALVLDEAVALLTLTGPGGVGKTRLALAVAHDVAASFADGVVFVDLAPLRDPALVLAAVAEALGVAESGARSLQAGVASFLRPRQILLVLDNFEHVLPAAPQAADLLAACPAVQMLVTSRAPLRVSGEQEFPVAPLALPDPTRLPPLGELAQSAAVALFVQRSRAVNPGFALTEANAVAVAEICHRLDGLPLALELAAARSKLLSPQALLALLSQRLRVLTVGRRGAPARQRTLRDAIAWSYDLLTAEGQALFGSLAVFVGGCTLAAAEYVGGKAARRQGGEGDDENSLPPGRLAAWPPSVFDGITALVDNSLLRQEAGPDGEPRYVMFETVREFALEHLEPSGHEDEVRGRHAGYFLALVEEAEAHLVQPGQERWLHRLAAEHDNLRAALAWLEQTGQAVALLRLAGALYYLWSIRGHSGEVREWLQRALSLAGDGAPAALRAKAIGGVGKAALSLGDPGRAEAHLAHGLALWRGLGDAEQVAVTLIRLALAVACQERYAEAAVRFGEALALCEEVGETSATAAPRASMALTELGWLAYEQGEYARAADCLAESLTRQTALGFSFGLADTHRHLGDLARAQGDMVEAVARYRESVEHACVDGDRQMAARPLAGVAAVALAVGQPERAARLLGAVVALDEVIGGPIYVSDQRTQAQTQAAARAALGETVFVAAWTAGRALPFEAAVAEALALADLGPAAEPASELPADQSVAAPFGLSPREREVLACLVRRDTAREIADRFGVSERTVEHQVESIYNKLGVSSRREAAAAALRSGLA